MYEKNNDRKFTIRISIADYEYLEQLAEINGKSISETTRLLIKAMRLKDKREGEEWQNSSRQ